MGEREPRVAAKGRSRDTLTARVGDGVVRVWVGLWTEKERGAERGKMEPRPVRVCWCPSVKIRRVLKEKRACLLIECGVGQWS